MLTVAGAWAGSGVIVLLPGFMIAPAGYEALARSLAGAGPTVVVPQLYRRGIGALAGRVDIADEAVRAADLVRATVRDHPGSPLHLAGHSRGGQAAWRATGLLAAAGCGPASLVVIDPVDGAGRNPTVPTSTAMPVSWAVPTLVLGAGVEGRCAPAPVNHRQFARAAPAARHLVVEGLGHADLLDGRSRSFGRRLCGGGPDPDAARGVLAAVLLAWIEAVGRAVRDPAGDPARGRVALPAVAGTTVLR
ncbi:chlorophyllase/cutinase-like alpha/beta fold protein [Nakamurella sp.]|uniref:thioesterase domain-containing protein n=1 Tax=Nakamurella sp. TaxID=1869182 RepID=UPI003B3A0EE3